MEVDKQSQLLLLYFKLDRKGSQLLFECDFASKQTTKFKTLGEIFEERSPVDVQKVQLLLKYFSLQIVLS